jgi:hypothetical protein
VEERNLQEAYEIAELLFIATGYSFFFNSCLSYKWQTKIEGKDLYYLTAACWDKQLENFLKGICYTFYKDRQNAITSFEDSTNNIETSKELPLYKISYKSGKIIFDSHIGMLADIANVNLQAILKIADINASKIVVDHPDLNMPYINSIGNLTMVKMAFNGATSAVDQRQKDRQKLKRARSKSIEYSIEEYDSVEVYITVEGIAENKIYLIPKENSGAPKKTLEFQNSSTNEYIFLLFLIYERKSQGEYWLDRLRSSIISKGEIYAKFIDVLKWCGLSEHDIGESTKNIWWFQREKRRELKRQILKKANLEGEIVRKTKWLGHSGNYELNPCLKKASIIKT